MPPPTDKQGLRRIMGMVNYLQKFAPGLSELTTPIRILLKDDAEFVWEESVEGECFKRVKAVIGSAPVLKYFDPSVEAVLQCDASQHGLGACLMQNGQPVAYASRSLTETEYNYVQMEKELLAIVFFFQIPHPIQARFKFPNPPRGGKETFLACYGSIRN